MSESERQEKAEDGSEHELRGPWWYSERRSVTEEQRGDVLRQLFYEGPDLAPFLTRFAALMAMAVLIALFGLAQDSGPVVIGAMLVSPLTTPILGLATALVLGHPRRQLNAALVLTGATVGGILIAIAVTWLIPDPQQTTLDSEQLLDRTTPDILDLAVAVVAGAAGAYILVRREAVSALPGVAIAVALVPPLTTVGMTIELGATELAEKAFLLYCTNLAGIILSASIVMLIMGVGFRPSEGRIPRRIKVGLTTALLAAIIVSLPLAAHTRETVHDANDGNAAERLATEWLDPTRLELGKVTVTEDHKVEIEVLGPDKPPPTAELTREIASEFDQPVVVTIRWTPVETRVSRASPDG